MSRSIRGNKQLKKVCGRVVHQQALTRANKRYNAENADACITTTKKVISGVKKYL